MAWKDIFNKITGKKQEPVKPAEPAPVAPVVKELPKQEADSITNELNSYKTTSSKGIDLIKSFEGLELKAYPDPGTGAAPWTIGYGHTGPDVKPGLVITEEKAEELLKKDLERFEAGVNDLVTATINQNQFDALVSFAYNCGLRNLATSTLLKFVNSGDTKGAAIQFLRWNKAAGKVLPGLTKRRVAESNLFLV